MSKLSFADVFNMARENADNPPVIQVRAQVAEVVPSVQRMMSEQHSRSRFIRVFKDTGRHLGRWEVFSDFLSLAASELDMARIRAPESIEHCRKICARYEASDIANMQEMFCMMVCALEAKFHDFLGAIFMELELGDNFRGQYFNPYSVQCLMAWMLMPGVRDTIRREGIATVSDPACGAAGMLIAYAECLLEADNLPDCGKKAAHLRCRLIPAALRAARISPSRVSLFSIIYLSLLYFIRHPAVYLFWYLSFALKIIKTGPGVIPGGTRLS
ncbi:MULTISPECIES: N-6 DNA methylase [Gammaproteobacteria]|uniref:N-6 DNA methylase n=1 Tax=Klebsiella oxytoca TaxID=571 RepID=UPI0021AE9FCE|nr:N-6 DNA methylase [Klebsiella oxytoca]